MSGRRFRILSDSEDEKAEDGETLEEKEKQISSSPAGPAAKKKKRARIVSDDSSNEGSGYAESDEEDENETSFGRRDASISQPQRIVRRPSSSENDEDRSDGNESTGNRNAESAQPVQTSREDDSDGDRSDHDRSDAAPPNSDDGNDADGENARPRDDEAEEDRGEPRRIVKKRVVKNPQPKLDAARLTGERGLGRLRNMYPLIRLKGKGHEHEDLKCILHNLQLWGHRMFPKMQTKDIFERCERLGTKMSVRVHLRRMRTGEIHDFVKPVVDSDDDVVRGLEDPLVDNHGGRASPMEVEEEQPPVRDERDIFQELLDEQHESNQTVTNQTRTEITDSAPSNQVDLKARIEEKRMEALRRREELRARREAQRKEEEMLEAQMVEMEAENSVNV